jgi:hypothetical protein
MHLQLLRDGFAAVLIAPRCAVQAQQQAGLGGRPLAPANNRAKSQQGINRAQGGGGGGAAPWFGKGNPAPCALAPLPLEARNRLLPLELNYLRHGPSWMLKTHASSKDSLRLVRFAREIPVAVE